MCPDTATARARRRTSRAAPSSGRPRRQATPGAWSRPALQELPEIGAEAPVGYGGGISLGTGIGVPLTAIEPRITAVIFGGGLFVHEALIEAARRITAPVQFLLP